MSLAGLMQQQVTLHRTTSDARDEIGGVSPGTETTLVVDAYIWPIAGTEDRQDRNTQQGTWKALIPAGTDVIGWDRLTYDGREFDITAPPEPVRNPRTDTPSHIRLRLQEVQ